MSLGSMGRSRRHLALRRGLVVGVCGLLTFAAVASAHHTQTSHKNHLSATSDLRCDSYFPTNAISALTGATMGRPEGAQIAGSWKAGTDNSMWEISHAGTPAGSECEWVAYSGPGLGDGDALEAWAAVGYGEPTKDWNEMWAHGGPAFTSEEGTLKSTAKVNLGHGAQAYVEEFDLWEVTGTTYFTPPKHLYAVTLLTKHHNLLLLAPETTPLATVETAAEHVLLAYPSF